MESRYGRPDASGKSTKAMGLAVSQKDCWRSIAISLIDQQSKRVIAGFRQLGLPQLGAVVKAEVQCGQRVALIATAERQNGQSLVTTTGGFCSSFTRFT